MNAAQSNSQEPFCDAVKCSSSKNDGPMTAKAVTTAYRWIP